jgi:hypothetical protein
LYVLGRANHTVGVWRGILQDEAVLSQAQAFKIQSQGCGDGRQNLFLQGRVRDGIELRRLFVPGWKDIDNTRRERIRLCRRHSDHLRERRRNIMFEFSINMESTLGNR